MTELDSDNSVNARPFHILRIYFTQYNVNDVLVMDAQWSSLKNLYVSANKTSPRTGRGRYY